MIIVFLVQCTLRAAFYQISCKAINDAALWLMAAIIKPFMTRLRDNFRRRYVDVRINVELQRHRVAERPTDMNACRSVFISYLQGTV